MFYVNVRSVQIVFFFQKKNSNFRNTSTVTVYHNLCNADIVDTLFLVCSVNIELNNNNNNNNNSK